MSICGATCNENNWKICICTLLFCCHLDRKIPNSFENTFETHKGLNITDAEHRPIAVEKKNFCQQNKMASNPRICVTFFWHLSNYSYFFDTAQSRFFSALFQVHFYECFFLLIFNYVKILEMILADVHIPIHNQTQVTTATNRLLYSNEGEIFVF